METKGFYPMAQDPRRSRALPLTDQDIQSFIQEGYFPLREAFPRELAAECRQLLWDQLDVDPEDRTTWTRPVIRLGEQRAEPFCRAANTARLHGAFDQLVGPGRWVAHPHLAGTVAVRFPVEGDPGDDGWHIDSSFYRHDSWAVNLRSEGRSLLMLFLFSDTGSDDAPTRIRVGSHLDVAKMLATVGEDGLSSAEIVLPPAVHERPQVYATGNAGDVFLCHPFLVHAADRHRGSLPRFLAQPGLLFSQGMTMELEREDGDYSPIEIAARLGLSRS
jgi:hypothetical protein